MPKEPGSMSGQFERMDLNQYCHDDPLIEAGTSLLASMA